METKTTKDKITEIVTNEPKKYLQTEVATKAGVTRERVRQIVNELNLNELFRKRSIFTMDKIKISTVPEESIPLRIRRDEYKDLIEKALNLEDGKALKIECAKNQVAGIRGSIIRKHKLYNLRLMATTRTLNGISFVFIYKI